MKIKVRKILVVLVFMLSLMLSACNLSLGDDSLRIVNDVFQNKLLTANVTVNAFNDKDYKISQGSGVIYKDYLGYFYAITNNHVVIGGASYSVRDAYGDEWDASLLACDENYDLAVVKFKIKSENEFTVPKIAEADPQLKDKILSISNPNGVINSLTLGVVEEYKVIPTLEEEEVDSDESSNVTFNVVRHSAPISSGSSGGAIFNLSYEICGINFASGKDKDGNFITSYAVQCTKLKEFLTANNLL